MLILINYPPRPPQGAWWNCFWKQNKTKNPESCAALMWGQSRCGNTYRWPELLLPADDICWLESSSSSREVAIDAVPVLVPGDRSVGLSSVDGWSPMGTMAEDVPPMPPTPPPPPPMVAMAELWLATLVPVEIVAHVGISAEFGLAGSIWKENEMRRLSGSVFSSIHMHQWKILNFGTKATQQMKIKTIISC